MSVGLFTSVYMSGHHQWHSNGVWWISRLAVHWDCHRTVSGAWSDLHCQCGCKEHCWSKRDIQWHGDSIICCPRYARLSLWQYTRLWTVLCVYVVLCVGIQVVYASSVIPYCLFKHHILFVVRHYSEYSNCNLNLHDLPM